MVDGVLQSGIYDSNMLLSKLTSSMPAAKIQLMNFQNMNMLNSSMFPPNAYNLTAPEAISSGSTSSYEMQQHSQGIANVASSSSYDSDVYAGGTSTSSYEMQQHSQGIASIASSSSSSSSSYDGGVYAGGTNSQPPSNTDLNSAANMISQKKSPNKGTVDNSMIYREQLMQYQPASKACNMRQLSAQGCSRAYIVKVLLCIAEFTKGRFLPSLFAFKKSIIQKWLDVAKEGCTSESNEAFKNMEEYFGGSAFDITNKGSHWQEPMHLFTWWKNSIERRVKFKLVQESAIYSGSNTKLLQKKRFCVALVVLTNIIRRNSESFATAAALGVHKRRYSSVPEGTDDDGKDESKEYYFVNPLHMSDPENIVNSAKATDEAIEDIKNMRDINISYLQACIDRRQKTLDPTTSKVDMKAIPTLPIPEHKPSDFIMKVFDLISDDSVDQICWTENGTQFQIEDPAAFKVVLSREFNHESYSLFQCQLNLYGIKMSNAVQGSPTTGEKRCYYHPQMLMGDRKACENITRVLASNLTDIELLALSKAFDDVVEPTKRARFRLFHVDDVGIEEIDADMFTLLTDYDNGDIESLLHSHLSSLLEILIESDKSDEQQAKRPRLEEPSCGSKRTYMDDYVMGRVTERRVGDEYQAIIPEEIPEEDRIVSTSNGIDCKIWSPYSDAQTTTVDIILQRIKERDIDTNLATGMVLVACIDKDINMCKLVTIVNLGDSPGADNAVSREVTVFDGAETYNITAGDLILYSPGFSDLIHEAIQNLAKLNHETYWSLNPKAQSIVCEKVESIAFKSYFMARKSGRIPYNDLGVFLAPKLAKYSDERGVQQYKEWSLVEVRMFCEGIQKFGGDLRKVWSTLEKSRAWQDVLDFYYRIYPFGRDGGVQRLLRVYEARDAALMGALDVAQTSDTNMEKRDLILQLIQLEKKREALKSSSPGYQDDHKSIPGNVLQYCPICDD